MFVRIVKFVIVFTANIVASLTWVKFSDRLYLDLSIYLQSGLHVSNKTNLLQPIETANLNDSVYQALRHWICEADLIPGQRLNLTKLEERLQVSRTPIKMALKQLELEGFVTIQARRGTFIASLDAESLDGNFKIRSSFELYVALCIFKYLTDDDYLFLEELSIQMENLVRTDNEDWRSIVMPYLELDQHFHKFLVMRGGPDRMLELHEQVDTHSHMMRMAKYFSFDDLQAMHQEHLMIFSAIMRQLPEALSETLLHHLESERRRALKLLSQ